jgi:S1-C subfamily serine protease
MRDVLVAGVVSILFISPAIAGAQSGADVTYIPNCEGNTEPCPWNLKRLGLRNAAVVTKVTCGSSADLAGLKRLDAIYSINDTKIDDMTSEEYNEAYLAFGRGEVVRLVVVREVDGRVVRRVIRLAARFFSQDWACMFS